MGTIYMESNSIFFPSDIDVPDVTPQSATVRFIDRTIGHLLLIDHFHPILKSTIITIYVFQILKIIR